MDPAKMREDFERLTPEEQMGFMAAVGPAFCRSVMADPARRRLMIARHLGKAACPLGRLTRRLAAAGITLAAFVAGVRAAAAHLAHGAPPEAAR